MVRTHGCDRTTVTDMVPNVPQRRLWRPRCTIRRARYSDRSQSANDGSLLNFCRVDACHAAAPYSHWKEEQHGSGGLGARPLRRWFERWIVRFALHRPQADPAEQGTLDSEISFSYSLPMSCRASDPLSPASPASHHRSRRKRIARRRRPPRRASAACTWRRSRRWTTW